MLTMKIKLLPLLALALLLSACPSTPEPEENATEEITTETTDSSTLSLSADTIHYRYITLVEKYKDCPEKQDPDNYCTQASATWVELTKAASPIVQKRINEALIQHLLASDTMVTVEQVLKDFIREYSEFAEEMKGEDMDFTPAWSMELSQKVAWNTPEIFVVENNIYSYSGGAHGGYASGYLNFSPRTGKLLTLEDLIDPGKMDAFKKLCEQYFLEKYPEDDFWFPEEGFYLPETFGLLPEGITFVYALYEIAPYAAGEIVFTVPYEKAKVFAKPYSVLDQMNK